MYSAGTAATSSSFRVEVELAGRRYPGCWGSSKREAERRAAAEALRELDPPNSEEEDS